MRGWTEITREGEDGQMWDNGGKGKRREYMMDGDIAEVKRGIQ